MKRFLILTALLLAPLARPAAAAELQVLSPVDKSLVRGTVQFQIRPVHTPLDQFLSNPYVVIRDRDGKELEEVRAPRNLQTGICSVAVDTTRFRDGQYQVEVKYRTLVRNQPQEVSELLTLGVRNTNLRPNRFTVQFEDRAYRLDEAADLTVRVLDGRGKPMEGARVAFKVDKGELPTPAEITDLDGEATLSLQSEELQNITLTITVEGLAPVTRTIRFAQ